MADRILIVEDEEKLAALLRDYLAQDGFEVAMLHRGDQVEEWVKAHPTDLVLLDLMLPGKGGLEVCKALRATSDVSIVMVTARVDEIDDPVGEQLGMDPEISVTLEQGQQGVGHPADPGLNRRTVGNAIRDHRGDGLVGVGDDRRMRLDQRIVDL